MFYYNKTYSALFIFKRNLSTLMTFHSPTKVLNYRKLDIQTLVFFIEDVHTKNCIQKRIKRPRNFRKKKANRKSEKQKKDRKNN